MSADDLKFFENNLKYFSNEGYLFSHVNDFGNEEEFDIVELNTQARLENYSVARFAAGFGEYCVKNPISNMTLKYFVLDYKYYSLLIWKDQERLEISYSMSLTAEGRLLRKFLKPEADLDYLTSMARKVSKQLKCKVSIHPANDDKSVSNLALVSFTNGEAESF